MQFTVRETKLIERLRKQDRQWVRVRWIMLVIAVFCIALSGGFGYMLYLFNSLNSQFEGQNFESTFVFFIVLIWTKCFLYFLFGMWCIVNTCVNWHGDVNRMLLLKLLDVQQNRLKDV